MGNTIKSSTEIKNVANPINQRSQILRLNIDCWEEIFDYLSLRDILAICQTCDEMQQIAGDYFHRNFPAIEWSWVRNELCPFIHKLIAPSYLRHTLNGNSYASLKTLIFNNIKITESYVGHIKGVLTRLDHIELHGCMIYGNSFKRILRHCPELKSLYMKKVIFLKRTSATNCMHEKCGTLKNFAYITSNVEPNGFTFEVFFKQNQNIKYLGINGSCLWMNRNTFLESNIQLDCLAIEIFEWHHNNIPSMHFVSLLEKLYACGFYKSLHCKMFGLTLTRPSFVKDLINELAKLITFDVFITSPDINLSHLIHLKELHIHGYQSIYGGMETLAMNLTKLERLYLYEAKTDDLVPFFRHSIKLNSFKVIRYYGGNLINGHALNLFALNRQREQLNGARKICLYVNEKIYLATKWKLNNLHLSLVQIAREESTSFGNEFASEG